VTRHQGRPPVILAVDPGRHKCGFAVLTLDGAVEGLWVAPRTELAQEVCRVVGELPVQAVLVGDRTGSKQALAELGSHDLPAPIRTAPEHETTLRARERYFRDNPPRGWRRLIPRGMLLPPRPVDDYAALVMAEDWLAARRSPRADAH